MKNFSKGFSQNIIIIIVLTALIIGAGIYFLVSQSNSENLGNKTESYFSDKVADMFEKGKPLECSSEVSDLEGSIKAVYYFDNKNKMVRVEMEMFNKATGSTTNTVSIIRDNWNYFWDDLMNKDGMKIKFDENEDSILPEENLKLENSDLKFDFVCKNWKVDSSKFDLPKDKSFTDLSDMLDGFNISPNGTSNSNSNLPGISLDNLCEMCNLLPEGPDRLECLDSCGQN
jgi:hypothetical protein